MHKNTLLKNLHRFKTATPFKEQTVVKDHVSEGCLMTQEITQDPTWNEKSYNSKLKLRVYPDAGFRVIFFPVPFSKISSLSSVSLDLPYQEKKSHLKPKMRWVSQHTCLGPWRGQGRSQSRSWQGDLPGSGVQRAWWPWGGLRRRQEGIRPLGPGGSGLAAEGPVWGQDPTPVGLWAHSLSVPCWSPRGSSGWPGCRKALDSPT